MTVNVRDRLLLFILLLLLLLLSSTVKRTIYNSKSYTLTFSEDVLYVTNTTDFSPRCFDSQPIQPPPSKHHRTPFQSNYSLYQQPTV